MSNPVIYYNNVLTPENIASGAVTLLITSEKATYKKEYLYDNHPGSTWTATSNALQIITFSFPTPTTLSRIVLLNINLVAGDTFIYEACANSSFSPAAISIPQDPTRPIISVNTYNYAYHRLKIQKVSDTPLYIGELLFYKNMYEIEDSYDWGYKTGLEIKWQTNHSITGQINRKLLYSRRFYNVEFSGIPDTLVSIFEIISLYNYIVFLPNGETGLYYYGCDEFSAFTHESNQAWNVSMSFIENPK